MECVLCKLQCVGKPETPLNLRLNNHKSDVFCRVVILSNTDFTNMQNLH